MWVSGQEMAHEAADRDKGVRHTINKLALEKRAKRLAEAAKAKAKRGR